ncbi:MAG: hypothetical protein NW226_22510 [Microscillaceae bacterium]|nr:hypothetical protein [Microscillaceae bacterium]
MSRDELSLHQGDFIRDCPIIVPPKDLEEGKTYDLQADIMDVIILSQSCDLENSKTEIVLVCPFFTFFDYKESLQPGEQKKEAVKKHFERLKQGIQPNYHLLNKDKNKGLDDYLIVDFRNVYGIHIEFLQEYVKSLENRVRLLPPYREHLSQAFARFFMRVGLPQNIPPLSL